MSPMAVLAFMSYGQAFVSIMGCIIGLGAYIVLFGWWSRTRATWAAIVLVLVPVALVVSVVRDVMAARSERSKEP